MALLMSVCTQHLPRHLLQTPLPWMASHLSEWLVFAACRSVGAVQFPASSVFSCDVGSGVCECVFLFLFIAVKTCVPLRFGSESMSTLDHQQPFKNLSVVPDVSLSNASFTSGFSTGPRNWSPRRSVTGCWFVPVSSWAVCVMHDVIGERQRAVILHRDSQASLSSALLPAFKRDPQRKRPSFFVQVNYRRRSGVRVSLTGERGLITGSWFVCCWTLTIESQLRSDWI